MERLSEQTCDDVLAVFKSASVAECIAFAHEAIKSAEGKATTSDREKRIMRSAQEFMLTVEAE